jgi:hypothetical protein
LNRKKLPLEGVMPLMRGRIVGYDATRMIFEFTMMHGAKMVDCEVSGVALDHLAGEKGTRPNEREAQFRRLRDAIEAFASEIFDKEVLPQGRTLRIFSKDMRRR